VLLRKVHNNDITAFILLPLFLIAFWLKSLQHVYIPEMYGDVTPMPLWGFVLSVIKGNRFAASAIVMLMALIAAMGVNRFTNRYKLIQKMTLLPGVVYIMLVSGLTTVQYIQPVWFFVPMLLLSLEKLFNASGKYKPMPWCFEAGFWFSAGTLFFAKGMVLYIFILLAMFILRVFNLRTVLASLFGILLPYLFAFGYYFATDKLPAFLDMLHVNFVSPVAFFSRTVYSTIYLAVMVFFVILSLINVARQMPTFKIITRKHYRIFNWLVILSLLAAMTPFYSVEMIPVISIGSSIVIAYFLDTTQRNYLKELYFTILIVVTILAHIYM
jgi:hypothetical protein